MRGALSLGKILGIKVYIHFTFLLIFLWVGYTVWSAGGEWLDMAIASAIVLVIFLSVLLHEFGHCLAARKYGIATRRIVLLPIGGVAQIERMPEKPAQELFVTVMGPFVNLVIALLTLPFVVQFFPAITVSFDSMDAFFDSFNPLFGNFIGYIFFYNCLLLVFNLVPAFPMDGGRILRALLSMRFDMKKATLIAARIGQVLAFGIFILGFFMNPMWILLGVFVMVGAEMELRMVTGKAALRELTVSQALQQNFTVLKAQEPLAGAVQLLLGGNEKDFLVEENGQITGLLTHDALAKALQTGETSQPILSLVKHDIPIVGLGYPIEDAMHLMAAHHVDLLPVVHEGQIVGVVTHQGISELLVLQNSLRPKGRKALSRLIQNRALGRVR
jgi:Zn-dependent protease